MIDVRALGILRSRIQVDIYPFATRAIIAIGTDSVGIARCVLKVNMVLDGMMRTADRMGLQEDREKDVASFRSAAEHFFHADLCPWTDHSGKSYSNGFAAVLAYDLYARRPNWFDRSNTALLGIYERMQRDQPVAAHERLDQSELAKARSLWQLQMRVVDPDARRERHHAMIADVEANSRPAITTIGSHVLDL